jgi:hypothetical protein
MGGRERRPVLHVRAGCECARLECQPHAQVVEVRIEAISGLLIATIHNVLASMGSPSRTFRTSQSFGLLYVQQPALSESPRPWPGHAWAHHEPKDNACTSDQ